MPPSSAGGASTVPSSAGRIWLLAALLLLGSGGLAGCLDATAPLDALSAESGALFVDGVAAPEAVHRWEGALRGPERTQQDYNLDLVCFVSGEGCPVAPPACDASRCARMSVRVEMDDDARAASSSALVASARWRLTESGYFDVWIEDASGAVVAYTPNTFVGNAGQTAVLEMPAPGTYDVVVAARWGGASYEAAVRFFSEARPAEPRELLPDLVTLAPSDLSLETPDYVGISYFAFPAPLVRDVAEAAGTRGCRVDEIVETEGRRCLRFSTAVGNIGAGPLDVLLPVDSQRFVQRIHRTDGGFTELEAGPAEWHATHAHWHNAAANLYTLHPYDPATGERGDALSVGKKGGICFADTGIVDVGLPSMRPPAYPGTGCVDPRAEQAWSMGISAGWYDLYGYVLSDQYLELTGVEDGTYTLCVIVNQDGTLHESNPENNESCTPFRLEGDDVILLQDPPYHSSR